MGVLLRSEQLGIMLQNTDMIKSLLMEVDKMIVGDVYVEEWTVRDMIPLISIHQCCIR